MLDFIIEVGPFCNGRYKIAKQSIIQFRSIKRSRRVQKPAPSQGVRHLIKTFKSTVDGAKKNTQGRGQFLRAMVRHRRNTIVERIDKIAKIRGSQNNFKLQKDNHLFEDEKNLFHFNNNHLFKLGKKAQMPTTALRKNPFSKCKLGK